MSKRPNPSKIFHSGTPSGSASSWISANTPPNESTDIRDLWVAVKEVGVVVGGFSEGKFLNADGRVVSATHWQRRFLRVG